MTPPEHPKVTVVVPMRNEEAFIELCLESIFRNTYSPEALEVIVVDGMSTDKSPEIVKRLQAANPNLVLVPNSRRTAPAGMNLGIQRASGEIIVRMDAHAVYESDYIANCVRLLQRGDAANVGGAQTAVGTDYISKAIALATTCPFGIGDAKYRFSTKEQFVDTVFLGAWTRATLVRLGGFNEDWVVNQDYELNYRLRKAGGKILFSPDIRCRYFVRPSLTKLVRQYFRYGFWKVKTLSVYPESARWRQLVPPIFVLALAASAALIPVAPGLACILPAIYVAATTAAATWTSVRGGWRYAPALMIVFPLLHLSWGMGFWCGMRRFGVPNFRVKDLLGAVKPIPTA